MRMRLLSLRRIGAMGVAALLLAAPLSFAQFVQQTGDMQATADDVLGDEVADVSPAAAYGHNVYNHAVYTANNSPDGNRVLVYDRFGGALVFDRSFPTGGMGTGGGLGNQGGVTLDDAGHLFVVNAGSNELSVFELARQALVLTDIVPSGGEMPISVTANGDIVYVLNAGNGGSITGFEIDGDGRLTPIPGSTQPLSGADMTGPAQVGFSPDGAFLVVTEKASSLIDVFPVDGAGVAGAAVVNASNGMTPFGFAFRDDGTLVVSEAFGGATDAAALSSYSINPDGTLATISASVPDTESAACWAVITRNGRYAYTTNTASGTVSGYRMNVAGSLTLLDADGETGIAGGGPIDAALSENSRYLFVLNAGTDDLSVFFVRQNNGGLISVGMVPGLPDGANGLAAR